MRPMFQSSYYSIKLSITGRVVQSAMTEFFTKKYAKGLLDGVNTGTIPFPLASHSTSNVCVKSGSLRTGALHIASLICSKAYYALSVQTKLPCFVHSVKGAKL